MQSRPGIHPYLASLLLVGAVTSQSVVKDINTATPSATSSSPTNMLTFGGVTLFAANDGFAGSELWKTDGTNAGTVMVKDINPGSGSSSPASLTLFNGFVYFSANNGTLGSELWRTDGTEAGTVLVADCYPGSGSATPSNLIVNGATMFFSAFDGATTGRELWKTDGTTAGTSLIIDTLVGTGSGIVSTAVTSYAPLGPGLVFPASTSTTAPGIGEELYYTDGTGAGTVLLADIFPGTASSTPRFLTPFGGRVYFTASSGTTAPGTGIELYVTDGTPAGTSLLIDIYPGTSSSSPSQPIVSAGRMFFSASDLTAGTGTGRELWVSDGTTAGTVLVKDNIVGTGSGIASQTLNIMVPFGGGVLVGMSDGTTAPAAGEELWFSDGTAAGTVRIADINVGTASSSPRAARIVGARVFFAATTAATGYELFVTDGTGAGTGLASDIFSGTSAGVSTAFPSADLGGSLVLAASNGTSSTSSGTELFLSDGTPAGTNLVKDIAITLPAASNPVNFASLGALTVFGATDGTSGVEPWVTDGTAAGTVRLIDAYPGTSSSSPANFTTMGSKCFFTATNSTTTTGTGTELYVTDGTPAGTSLLLDINSGTASSSPINLVVSNGRLWFLAITAAAGRELWVSDGTPGGTTMVADFNPGTASGAQSFAQSMIPWGSGVMFSGTDPALGTEICVSDGTVAGTVAIDFVPGAAGTVPSPFIVMGGYAYCNATDGTNGYELVKTDGTLAGTSVVKDIVPGVGEGNPGPFAVLNNRLYFFATDPATGTELWVSDGTAAGTVLLADMNPGAGSSVTNNPFAANLVVAGGRMCFPADDGTNGVELWSSDGTTPGTLMTRDLNPGAGSGMTGVTAVAYPLGVGGRVAFAGNDGARGSEPCMSNGTPAGTVLIADVYPGPIGSAPAQFVTNSAASLVYFSALDPIAGREPMSISTTALGVALAEVFGGGCAGTGGLIPRIGFGGAPEIGTTFDVTLTNARATTPCLLFINGARSDLPLPGGCTVYPLQPAIDVWSGTDALGSTTLSLPFPANTTLIGLGLFMQWTAFDPNGSFQSFLSFSDALRAVIGQL